MNNQFINRALIDWNRIDSESYLRGIEDINRVREIEFSSPVTIFVGENGDGKSSLPEAIAIAYGFNPESGTKNYFFSTYDSPSKLCSAIRLVR